VLERLIMLLAPGALPAVFVPSFVSTSAPGRVGAELVRSFLRTFRESRCLSASIVEDRNTQQSGAPLLSANDEGIADDFDKVNESASALYALGAVNAGRFP
jgi:hypothetical protein